MLAAMICSSSRPAAAPARIRGHPPERAPARQHRGDDAIVGPASGRMVERHPVADGREVGRRERVVAEPPGHDRPIDRPSPSRTIERLLWTATTRAGRRPTGRERREGLRPAGVPAKPASMVGRRSISCSADPLELAGALGVALRAAERPQPERDEDDAHHDERPDVVQQLADRRAVDQSGPDARRGRTWPATAATAPASTRAGSRSSSRRR